MFKKLLVIASVFALGACAGEDGATDPVGSASMGDASVTAGQVMGALQSEGTRFVKVPSLYIRTGPGMKYKTVGTVQFNQEIQVLETLYNGAWIKIGEGQYIGGRYLSGSKNDKAWIPEKYAH